jgi:hypothetical protein
MFGPLFEAIQTVFLTAFVDILQILFGNLFGF